MDRTRTYPHGVTCWIDTDQPDPGAARDFYRRLFGWEFTEATPTGAPGSYQIATLHGQDAAAIAPGESTAGWNTYVAVDDADTAAAAVAAAGGQVLSAPADAGPAGRAGTCVDPAGARFRLWQARRRLGVQVCNEPGAWNFSNLRTADTAAAERFYGPVFGWQFVAIEDLHASIRVPGYGRHLADTVDPGIYERQAAAPDGFADVIGGILPLGDAPAPHWQVMFTVADRDAAAGTVERLGGSVHTSTDTLWTRQALVSDPQGARFVLSQFTPPS